MKVAERLKTGEPLAHICRENTMPSNDAIDDWCERFPEVKRIIAAARVRGFDAIAAECLAIADDGSNDYVDTEHGPRLDAEHVQRSKLRIETRLNLLAKWDPKRYGDKVAVDHSGQIDSRITLPEAERLELIEQRRRILTGAN